MNRLTPHQVATEPDVRALPAAPAHPYRRVVKIVGDVLWYAFLSVVLGSVAVGLVGRLFF